MSAETAESSNRTRTVLIIVGVIVTLMLIAVGTCMYFSEDILRNFTVRAVAEFQTEVLADTTLVVDSVAFTNVTNAFIERVKVAELTKEGTQFQAFMLTMKNVFEDKNISQNEVDSAVHAMIRFYPDLQQHWPIEPSPDSITNPILDSVQVDTLTAFDVPPTQDTIPVIDSAP